MWFARLAGMQTVAERGSLPMKGYDEKFKRVDERFDEVDRRISEGREEAQQRFDRVEGDTRHLREVGIPSLKGEVKGEISELKVDIREVREGLAEVQTSFNHFVMGAAASWVILMVTILTKG